MVFLKAPRPGLVKTRLAHDIGAASAVRIYRALVAHQLRHLPRETTVEIHYAPRGFGPAMRAWLGPHRTYRAQSPGDLGRRLERAFESVFARGATRALAIGGDCPTLDGATLHAATEQLAHVDLVLGPATDGGYYLIALRRPAPELFANIPWSSSAVLSATLDRARSSGISFTLLDEKEDIDDVASLRRLRKRGGTPAMPWLQRKASGS